MSVRFGLGYDAHRLVNGRRLVLGGVEIDHDLGLTGHSDADVLAHAIIDALLGAAGLGDIGQHFPDDDERWRDADSLELLSHVCVFLEEHDWSIVHLDATVVCESPRLGGYRDEIRRSLAATAGITAREVNVKFTTNEGMGFVGRGEGIAALAIATVEREE
jgi:2-C-methyl-D-erythritol 2,4-cyclodiphosphate synthase